MKLVFDPATFYRSLVSLVLLLLPWRRSTSDRTLLYVRDWAVSDKVLLTPCRIPTWIACTRDPPADNTRAKGVGPVSQHSGAGGVE